MAAQTISVEKLLYNLLVHPLSCYIILFILAYLTFIILEIYVPFSEKRTLPDFHIFLATKLMHEHRFSLSIYRCDLKFVPINNGLFYNDKLSYHCTLVTSNISLRT